MSTEYAHPGYSSCHYEGSACTATRPRKHFKFRQQLVDTLKYLEKLLEKAMLL